MLPREGSQISKGILRSASQTFHEAAQFFAPARVAQFTQGLSFDLPDTFAGHFEILTDFFESMVGGFADTKTLPQNLFFPWRERFQCTVDLALEIVPNRRLQRRHRLFVFDKVPQMAVFLLTDRGLQRNRLARDFQYLPAVFVGDIPAVLHFLPGWLPSPRV